MRPTRTDAAILDGIGTPREATECMGCGKPLAECAVVAPEPPDHTRIEFEHWTDVFAAWREDWSSKMAGYTVGDGGKVWCLYGRTVPVTWAGLAADFGHCVLAQAVRLIPHADDLAKREQWPTQVYARRHDREELP